MESERIENVGGRMKIGQINEKTIATALSLTERKRRIAGQMIERYDQEKLPIQERKYEIDGEEQKGLIKRLLSVDIFSEIVDISTGYLVGIPVAINLNKDRYKREQTLFSKLKEKVLPGSPEMKLDEDSYRLQRYGIINDIDLQNAEVEKFCSIAGNCGRLSYVSGTEIMSKTIKPSECSFFDDAALYLSSVEEITENTVKTVLYCRAYDAVNMYEFKNDGEWKFVKEVPHGFDGIPLIECKNNERGNADAYNVIDLLDQLDRIVSDWASETEQGRLAALIAMGKTKPSDTFIAELKKNGGAYLPDGTDIKYITKEIPFEQILALLKFLREEALYTSKTPNMRDESFGGNLSGVALEYKFRPFEFKCVTKERYFTAFLREHYRLVCGIMRKFGKGDIAYSAIDFTFTRNYPKNLFEEAQTQSLLDGKVPVKDRLKLCSFISDPDKAAKELEAEQGESLYKGSFSKTRTEGEKDPNEDIEEEESGYKTSA